MEKNKPPIPTVAVPEKDLEVQCPATHDGAQCLRHAGHTFAHLGISERGLEKSWDDPKPEASK